MILLNSLDRAVDHAILDPVSREINFFSDDRTKGTEYQLISGLYSIVDGSPVVFYRDMQELKLMLAGEVYVIDETTRSELHQGKRTLTRLIHDRFPGVSKVFPPRFHHFHLFQNEKPVVRFRYRAPVIQRFAFDPTPFVEDEHFDLMLFIHNVLRDPGRRNRIWLDDAD